MAHYGMSRKDTLELPAVCFWLLFKNADRHDAADGMQSTQIGIGVQSEKGARGLLTTFQNTLGNVVVMNETHNVEVALKSEKDSGGIAFLKILGRTR